MNNARKIMLLFFLFTFLPMAHAIEIEKRDVKGEADVWFKLDKLHEAEELVISGDIHKARILLEGLIDQFPDYKEAKVLYSELSDKSIADGKRFNLMKQEKVDSANEYWLDYLKYKDSGDLARAREKLLAIKKMYGKGDARPAFLSNLETEAEKIDAKVGFLLNGEMRAIDSGLSNLASVEGSVKRLTKLVGWYGRIRQILLKYKDYPPASSLKNRVVQELNKAARIIYAQAATLRDLEGCGLAGDKFKTLLTILAYPELDFYKRAKMELSHCED